MLLLPYLFRPLSVNVGDEAGDGNPEEEADDNDGAHNVVLEEFEHRVDVKVIDEVPDALNHVLHRPLTLAHVAETLVAWCAIRQPVRPSHGLDGRASGVEVLAAASGEKKNIFCLMAYGRR